MPEFVGEIDAVIQRAKDAGVVRINTVCTHPNDLSDLLHIADCNPEVFSSVGVHPCNIDDGVYDSDRLIQLSRSHKKIIAFGETGLDYYHPGYDKSIQQYSFEQHIHASQITGLPVIVHTRDAESDTIDIISNLMLSKTFTGVIHCFTASKEFAIKALDLGLYISLAGIVTFKNAELIRDAISIIPLDRILIETDAPFLAPAPMRGKRNEPSYVKYTAEYLAKYLNKSYEEIAQTTTENACRLFKYPE
jgi:TatD DNase family protein